MDELSAYDYALPDELIAQQPVANRTDARLLVAERSAGRLTHQHIRDLPYWLRPGDCLVLNDTRVVPARIVGRRERTNGRWQGLYLGSDSDGIWKLLAKTRGKLEPGETILLEARSTVKELELRLIRRDEGGVWWAVPDSLEPPLTLLERFGRVPLPHYIRQGEMRDEDLQWYQTVYARRPGSVAAPTAGLHFSQDLLKRLAAGGVDVCYLTLHVGLDTFRPITASRLADHAMHSEYCELTAATAERINVSRRAGGRVVAVGTTTVRVLETAAQGGTAKAFCGPTSLFIRPPYEFQLVDALFTNFHLPRTSLLVLVRMFGGDEFMRRAYSAAVEDRYRFFSYGDAMLIL